MTELKRTTHHSVMLDLELAAVTQKTVGCLLLERRCVWTAYNCTRSGKSSLGKCQDEGECVYGYWAVEILDSLSRMAVHFLIMKNLKISGK